MKNLDTINNKILQGESLARQLAFWRFKAKQIVFTNGCFDLIHQGHIDYLAKAKDLGDILIVGINTDSSVQRLKGKTRPIQDEKSRSMILSALSFVDAVILFDEETPYELIKRIMPNTLVKGSDYTIENIVGSDIVLANNGKVETMEFIPGYSTSLIEQRIIEANKTK